MKWTRLIALGIGMSATVWLTISIVLIHLGITVQLTESNFIIRIIEIVMGIFATAILIKMIIEEICKQD